jgi:hypothetical protein
VVDRWVGPRDVGRAEPLPERDTRNQEEVEGARWDDDGGHEPDLEDETRSP